MSHQSTNAVIRNLLKDKPGTFEPWGYSFGTDRIRFEERARTHLSDRSNLRTNTLDAADWDEVFTAFVEVD